MTGEEIRRMAELHTEGDTIPRAFALKIINECLQMDLGKAARVLRSVEITADKDTFHPLPGDFLHVVEITKQNRDQPYYGLWYGHEYRGALDIRDGQIRFPEAGDYTIHYFALPAPLAEILDTPAVHEMLHYPISLFLAARYKQRDDEENRDAARLMAEYQAYKDKAIYELNSIAPTTRPSRRMRARRWA